jgi:hypothetical protein
METENFKKNYLASICYNGYSNPLSLIEALATNSEIRCDAFGVELVKANPPKVEPAKEKNQASARNRALLAYFFDSIKFSE